MKLILIFALFLQAAIITCDTPQDGGLYIIIPKGSPGKALAIQGDSPDDGALVIAEALNCNDYQKFALKQYDANSFTVFVKATGKALTANGPNPGDFTVLYQREEDHAVYYQEITFAPGPDGYYFIQMESAATQYYTLNVDGQTLTFIPVPADDSQLFWVQATTTTPNQCKDCVAPQAYLTTTRDCGTCSAPQVYDSSTFACENCPDGDDYNFDGTCISEEECPGNLRDNQGGAPICKFPCSKTQIYQPATKKCKCTCTSPFTQETVNGYQICVSV